MRALAAFLAVWTILAVLWEAFETVILPRSVERKIRFTRIFYIVTWIPWRTLSLRIGSPRKRESMLSFYGPFSLVALFAAWAVLLVLSFGFLQWGLGSGLKNVSGAPPTLGTAIYMSGTTLFTLGLGDISPETTAARTVSVIESATGLGLVALVISYLPTLYQAFARREVNIVLLASRAGSPPAAAQFFVNLQGSSPVDYLADCELWAAEVLENQVSYPVLCYFRSHHANESWLSAMTAILDICVEVERFGDPSHRRQAALTFTMVQHALVDIATVFGIRPNPEDVSESHSSYRPYAQALAGYLAIDLPANNYNG